MKKNLATLLLTLFMAFGPTGCNLFNGVPYSVFFKGERELRKMSERSSVKSDTSTAFFLVVGQSDTKTNTETSVKFAWKMNDGIFAFSSLPLEKIRVQIDETAKKPTLRFVFKWKNGSISPEKELQEILNEDVLYALVKTTAENWPIDVNLPMN